ALADVDVAPCELQRRIQLHVRRFFDRPGDGEKRRYLDDAANTGGCNDRDDKTDRGTLELAVEQFRHLVIPPATRQSRRACLPLVSPSGALIAPSSTCCSSRPPRRSGRADPRRCAQCSMGTLLRGSRRTNTQASRPRCRSATSVPE